MRILVASVAGLIGFFPIFWLFTWVTGSNDIGAVVALLLGFGGIPALILTFWRSSAAARKRNRILGAIGLVWLGAALVVGIFRGVPEGSSSYAQGQRGALVFMALMFAVGLYYLCKRTEKTDKQ